MKPILLASVAACRMEPVPDGVKETNDFDGTVQAVKWAMNEVLAKGHKSVYDNVRKNLAET